MSYTTNYAKSDTPIRKALSDNRFWLGDKYKDMMLIMINSRRANNDDDSFHFHASFMGIQGFTVNVMMDAVDRWLRLNG